MEELAEGNYWFGLRRQGQGPQGRGATPLNPRDRRKQRRMEELAGGNYLAGTEEKIVD
jgi:hypothetical protein